MSVSSWLHPHQENFVKPAAQCDEDPSDFDAMLGSPTRSKLRNLDTLPRSKQSLPRVKQMDLEALTAGSIISSWEPYKWARVKTLAPAAAGQGVVELRTSQEQPAQSVAVKIMPRNLLRSCPEEFDRAFPDAKERPWIDIAIVKRLNILKFPYTCKFLGVFADQEQVYIMTSFATRGDLFTWCQTDKTMAGMAREAAMRPVISQLFRGVSWLHNLGVAHLDLSCENVMLTQNGENELQVKIIDFGMASLSRTMQAVRGKRSYQAPEMHVLAVYDTFLADDFSIGVIVYCMAVHYYPWQYTKPGKDRGCEFARSHGMLTFLRKKRMPCDKRPIAEVFSRAFLELLCGLLAFTPELRHSIGEECFEHGTRQALNAKSPWLSAVV